MKFVLRGAAVGLLALTVGCGQGEGEAVGVIAGGVIGGLAGSEVGSGSGRDVAIATGAVLGAFVGQEIGRRLDEHSRIKAAGARTQALDQGLVGENIVWENPDNAGGGARGLVVVNRSGRDAAGQTCREYTQEVTIAGDTETLIGTACLGADGRWTDVS